jgi:hypothetical protein
MKKRLLISALSMIGLGFGAQVWAADAQLTINLATIEGAKVRRPYVAVWIEKAGSHEFAGNIAVWYDMRKPNNIGATKWLPDLRSWWRASGLWGHPPCRGACSQYR